MKIQKISKNSDDSRILSLRRLPSGFGSVRYLGKGRCCPYAVHPPESSKKSSQSVSKRPPALCYVHNRETGIKILMIYHAGLYEPGLENDPVHLNQLYKKVLEMEDRTETRNEENISRKKASEYTMYEGSSVGISPLSRKDTDTGDVSDVGDPSAESGKTPAWNSSGNPSDVLAGGDRPPVIKHGIPPDEDLCEGPNMPLSGNSDVSDVSFTIEQASRNAEEAAVITGNSGRLSGHGQSESIEDLYRRLNSLQDTIRNLLQDIERMKTDYGGASKDWSSAVSSAVQPISSKTAGVPILTQPAGSSILYQSAGYPISSQSAGLSISPQAEASPGSGHAPALSKVYSAFHQFKYGPQAAKQLSVSSRNATAAAYRKLSCFYDLSLDEISVMEWQKLVNETAAAGHSRAAVTDLVTLIRQLYRFAYPRDMCTREHGKYVVMPYTSEEMHHQDFTDAELKILWENRNDSVVRMLLIMCYSGFRIGEFETLQVVLDQDGRTGYFCGGIKTKAGKNRIVPVHSAIMPLLEQILDSDGQPVFFCGRSNRRFREYMKQTLIRLGIDAVPDKDHDSALPGKRGAVPKIGETASESNRDATGKNETASENNRDETRKNETASESNRGALEKGGATPDRPKMLSGIYRPLANSPPFTAVYRELTHGDGESRYHTPHSCRHTFSRLCESYGVSEADRKRMLGHSFGNDITNGVYGHRSVEELRTEIEKIKIPEM